MYGAVFVAPKCHWQCINKCQWQC